jgi:hypothetical protein
LTLGVGRFVRLFPLGCASAWRWSRDHPDGSEPRTSSGPERADTAYGAPMAAVAAGGYASCQVRKFLSERAGGHRPALLRAAPISPMTGAEVILARLPLVVLLGGHRPHKTDHPLLERTLSERPKEGLSVYRPRLPKTRQGVDLRVIPAHVHYRASQAIVSSYMMGTWVAWHIRRRPLRS